MNRRILVTGSFLLLSLIMMVDGHSQQKSFKIYTADEGLISNQINKIFQDKDGFMWFGSNDGLSIYDGNHFVNFTVENKGLSQNSSSFFFEKSEKEVWIPHSRGIDVFVDRKFARTIPVKQINTLIRTRDGRILAAGDGGIYEIKNENQIKIFSSAKSFYDLYEAGNYFITSESSWESITLFDQSFNIVTTFENDGIICRDKIGTYWFYNGGQSWLIDTLALKRGKISLIPVPPPLRAFAKDGISYPFMDSDSSYWVSLINKGALHVNKDGSARKYDMANGLNSNSTTFFF